MKDTKKFALAMSDTMTTTYTIKAIAAIRDSVPTGSPEWLRMCMWIDETIRAEREARACKHDNFDDYFCRCIDCGYEPTHEEMYPDSTNERGNQ